MFISLYKFSSWFLSRIYILTFLLVERLPLKRAHKFGSYCGLILFYLSSDRKQIVNNNIQNLKDWAVSKNFKNPLLLEENQNIAKEIYRSNGSNFFSAISLMNKPLELIKKHLRFENLELIKRIQNNDKGILMLFSHSGPWELTVLLPLLAPPFFETKKTIIVYRPLNNVYFNKWYFEKRSRFGAQLFSKEDGFLNMVKELKKGASVFLASDIRMHSGPKFKLFNKEASVSKIPYSFYKASKAPVIAINIVEEEPLKWKIKFTEIITNVNEVCSESSLLSLINEHLEQTIFEKPQDYFFFQDRYK